MKKVFIILTLLVVPLFIVGCGNNKNVEGKLEEIMTKVYASVPEDKLPMKLTNTEVTKENVENYLGTSDIEFESALASESMINAVAHSVVLVRAKDGQDVNKLKETIKNNVNPRKWICVSVEDDNVIVDSKGNLVILIMDNDNAQTIYKDFQKLK